VSEQGEGPVTIAVAGVAAGSGGSTGGTDEEDKDVS